MIALLAIGAALLLAACAPAPDPEPPLGRVRIVGSDTMMPLVQRWCAGFMQAHRGLALYAEGGGSGTGIEALIAGRAQIAAVSRPLEATELKRLFDRRGSLGQRILTARDALSIYLHPANPVDDLTLEQAAGILSGDIDNWRQVGGPDCPIAVIGRQPNSGTYHFLREHLLRGRPYAPGARPRPTTAAVVEAVAADTAAIGYGGIAYGLDLTHCRIDGIAPTVARVRDGSYPLSRYLYLFLTTPARGPLKAFVDFVLSDEGQRLVAEVGYVPLWDVAPRKKPPIP